MKVIYNPKDGAPITQFIYKGLQLDSHFPDGFAFEDGTFSKGLKQYEDDVAKELIETYAFLEEKSPEEAQKMMEEPEDKEFKCDFPNCGFSSKAAIGLAGHKRSHKNDLQKPAVDPSLIPVAGGRRLLTPEEQKAENNKGSDIENGPDKDGVNWYGEGVKAENKSASAFNSVRRPGQGHFVG